MKNVLWTETAKKDLQHIYDYISEDSIYYADKFVDELIVKTNNISIFPNSTAGKQIFYILV
jgi:plasmid stabilization system protein ParE